MDEDYSLSSLSQIQQIIIFEIAWDTRFIHLYTTCATCMNYLGESTRALIFLILLIAKARGYLLTQISH
jgi:hypothetical protein